MKLHESAFKYLKPTDDQLKQMEVVRCEFCAFACKLEALLPDGADKTYILRKVREIGMWANVSITRRADGTPRE